MRPPAAPESDDGEGAPARDRGAVRPSGALTQVPSTAPNPQIAPRAPRSARAPLTLRPTPAAALLQPGRAGCRRGRGAWWARRGGSARAPRDRVGRVGRTERSTRRLRLRLYKNPKRRSPEAGKRSARSAQIKIQSSTSSKKTKIWAPVSWYVVVDSSGPFRVQSKIHSLANLAYVVVT